MAQVGTTGTRFLDSKQALLVQGAPLSPTGSEAQSLKPSHHASHPQVFKHSGNLESCMDELLGSHHFPFSAEQTTHFSFWQKQPDT